MTRRAFTFLMAGTALRAETLKERGKRMLDKCVYAVGGDAFRNLRTRTEIGRAYSFYHENLSGLAIARIYTKYVSRPDLSEVQRQVLGKKQEDTVILTPSGACEITFRGAKALPPERVEQFRESVVHDIFYILRERLNEPGVEWESSGSDVIENQPVEVLNFYDAQDRNVTVWINADTFLPVRQRFQHWDNIIKDRREEVTRYSKYRDVGNGVMWPFAIERERDGEKIFNMFSERVTVNDPLDDKLFELPPGIRNALK